MTILNTIIKEVQEEVELEAICAVFEELMKNEPIAVLRALRPYGVKENAEEAAIEPEAVEQFHEDLISNISEEESLSLSNEEEEAGIRRSRRIKKPQLSASTEGVSPIQFSIFNNRTEKVHSKTKPFLARIHTGEKEFQCTICDKRFSQKCHMNDHTIIHTEQKRFECSFCRKRFGFKSVLNIHTRIHTGEKPFQCTICHKRFGHKKYLDVHTRVHTGEKPFQCTICGKRFIQKSSLNTHTRIHTGEKPFECSFCNMSFRHKSSLKLHTKIH